jgi:F-box protein 9
MEDQNPELEAFRRQWREEVSAKSQDGSRSVAGPSKSTRRPPPITRTSTRRPSKPSAEEEEDHGEPQTFPGIDAPRNPEAKDTESSQDGDREPESALEHYEKAVEKESQGNLGDSLKLYRKAYRVSLLAVAL